MTASRGRLAELVALSIAVGVALLLGPSACDGCGTTTGSVYFYDSDYYLWAWERSGRTLEVGGVVPTSSSGVIAAIPPGEACPPASAVPAYAREVLRPDDPQEPYRNIRLSPDPKSYWQGKTCKFDYDHDYCLGKP
jgi:hypothetical protein